MNWQSESCAYSAPSADELQDAFVQKHGPLSSVGWGPRRRARFGYYLPADVYETLMRRVVSAGCSWLDVGGGRHLFPENPRLARELASRCARVVAVDPSDNVHENVHVHERVQSTIEDYRTGAPFDVVSLRMVAEHIADPEAAVAALARLLKPGGVAVVFTVNAASPLTFVSAATPFALHGPLKRAFWGGEDKDSFPVQYKMNSRRTLRTHFEPHGLKEVAFAYLDDLSTCAAFRYLSYIELTAWRAARVLGLTYPENCLLAVFRKSQGR